MLLCDSLSEYFHLISQFIYLQVLASPSPSPLRDASAVPISGWLCRSTERSGLAPEDPAVPQASWAGSWHPWGAGRPAEQGGCREVGVRCLSLAPCASVSSIMGGGPAAGGGVWVWGVSPTPASCGGWGRRAQEARAGQLPRPGPVPLPIRPTRPSLPGSFQRALTV